MRAVWKGTIGFGDYAIPVKAYSAVGEHAVPLHQVHEPDGGRIRVRRVCEVDGADVPDAEIVKGYPVPGGDVVVLTEDDLARLPSPPADTIDVHGFVLAADIDPACFAKSYYLEPEPAGTKPYVLLASALLETQRMAVVKVALRRRETLGALRVRDQTIVLQTLLWPDEVRRPDFPFLHEDVDLRRGELRRAVNLVEELGADLASYTDEHREALEALIRAKAEGGDVERPTGREQDEGVTRLLMALQQRTVDSDPTPVDTARAAAAMASRARAAARKAASKRGLSSST
jgi:DNA end-binding protein Ku